MIIIEGKYNIAKVFTDVVEETALSQIKTLCDQEFVKDSKLRIMPDVHAGAGCTIGTTMTIRDKIVPNLVGVDIGCGMETIQVKNKHIELQKLDKLIYEEIPSGFNIRKKPHKYNDEVDLTALRCRLDAKINIARAQMSLGTLGGGNHFIEVDQDEEGNLYIVVHSGSRHLGLEVANYYQEQAYRSLNQNTAQDIYHLAEEYKAVGKDHEIQSAIKALKKQIKTEIPKQLTYVSGRLMEDYIHDMKIVQRFAMLNRKAMMDVIIKGMKLKVVEEFTTIHNYIDIENMILRKGAVSATKGEKLLIPINMRDGSLICIGKGNPDWNQSAPHGAGRLMSRKQAKNAYTVSEFKKEMKGIYTTSVNDKTLDECPMAYKGMEDIVSNIADTVEIMEVIKPIYNFKAGEE
ncbi:RNA-splicing ligase RtcB, repairs tRNA damage [Anaerosporobacter mobilis DSM 15930]|jgi:RNA-splicing ligase RtcB|uniref:3'-phosphate/5'-hydroxy nucleic acid ligase n=1 Tax=Anaerosporobacter mobilis DSM 15930 TaxID=1120996 RepID=A0A1M7IIT8_9FIRM|nr:RtcB family protein [Anaerosporobacter mobilis]SHM40518.1 RNA-splicing ligase RtcB, repairs tRNA damage [Anaerosporobacter mobilis DSM 15930]